MNTLLKIFQVKNNDTNKIRRREKFPNENYFEKFSLQAENVWQKEKEKKMQ